MITTRYWQTTDIMKPLEPEPWYFCLALDFCSSISSRSHDKEIHIRSLEFVLNWCLQVLYPYTMSRFSDLQLALYPVMPVVCALVAIMVLPQSWHYFKLITLNSNYNLYVWQFYLKKNKIKNMKTLKKRVMDANLIFKSFSFRGRSVRGILNRITFVIILRICPSLSKTFQKPFWPSHYHNIKQV